MTLTIILVSLGAFAATCLGGAVALRLRDKLHLILGFSAGAVLAVAFFDLLPESLSLGGTHFSSSLLLSVCALGFFAYTVLDRIVVLHTHTDDAEDSAHIHSPERGIAAAGSLSAHSLLDGVAIGLAFQASLPVGMVVTAAVLAHDFSDGINTVNMVIKNGGTKRNAVLWLLTDAVAPVIGAVGTLFFPLPEATLSLLLALFAGFFLYIGASDLLPESHHAHPKFLTTALTLCGAAALYVVIKLAS